MKRCERCEGEFVSKGVLTSGNSKYIVWKCKNCGHETMQCTGLI